MDDTRASRVPNHAVQFGSITAVLASISCTTTRIELTTAVSCHSRRRCAAALTATVLASARLCVAQLDWLSELCCC